MKAAKDGDVQTVKEFIAAKKNINVQEKDGRTLLMNAASNRHGEIVKLLLDSGADVHILTNSQKTVLNYTLCSAFGFNTGGKRGSYSTLEILSLLLARNPAVSQSDISFAILFHGQDVLNFLLKKVTANHRLLLQAIDYAEKNAFEYDLDEASVDKNINIVRSCLKHLK